MNNFKRILSILLALVLTMSATAAMAENAGETVFPEELIVGHTTITKGDFFTEMFGNDTSDIDVRALIHGYNLINWDQNQGTYVWDPSVVPDVVRSTDELGNVRYNIVLADNLNYSDGSHITCWDYAFSMLLMMSPEIEQIGGKIYRAEHLLGYDDYIATRRKALAGEDISGEVDYLAGVTVIDDYQMQIILDGDFLPYFFETGLLLTVPYPISVIAPGCRVAPGLDDGISTYGIRIVNEDESAAPVYTAELLRKTILDPETGYNTFPSVVSGPYVLKSWDGETGHFEINPEFKGAWMRNNLPGNEDGLEMERVYEAARKQEGKVVQDTDAFGNPVTVKNAAGEDMPVELVRPTIRKIAFTLARNVNNEDENQEDMIDLLNKGELHLVNKVTYGETIQKGIGSELRRQNYPRIGLSFLTFSYDWPTVHEQEVRQAIAWCMDREGLTEEYCKGFGLVMDGYYGMEQWEYLIVNGTQEIPLIRLNPEDGTGVQEGSDEDPARKYKNLYYRTEAEYEQLAAAWELLKNRWQDTLVHYEVNLDKAKALLEKAGWTLNREGNPFREGTDDVRCKQLEDGTIATLDLTMMYPDGNEMGKSIMGTEGRFIDNLSRIGIRLTPVPAQMQDLLRSYYRETDRTTDMIYLATNFHVVVDPSITYSTDNSIGHLVWNNTYSDDEELYRRAVSMRKTEPGDIYTYVEKWIEFQERYNEVLPTIPVYSNIYFDFFTPYLQNYYITAQVTWSQAILLAYWGEPEAETVPEAEPDEEPDLE